MSYFQIPYVISCSIYLTLPVLYHISLGVDHFICLLVLPMGKGPKLMKLGVGASDWVEKDEDSPFLRICYPGYFRYLFLENRKRLLVHSWKPQILKHHSEIPQSTIIYIQLAHRNHLFFPPTCQHY